MSLETTAWIDGTSCVGCGKCVPVCPTGAIIGGPQHLHVIIQAACIGCARCIEPCPVDCIQLLPLPKEAAFPKRAASQLVRWRQESQPPSPLMDLHQTDENHRLIQRLQHRE